MRKRVAVATVIGLVLVVAVGAAWWWRGQQSELERAVSFAPAATERLTWTDWEGLRADLDADLDGGSPTDELAAFLDRGHAADLTSTSALLGSSESLHQQFGFSPATIEWEVLSQSAEGAVVIVQLPEGADVDGVADRLEGLGYARPDSETGIWRGGTDVVARIRPAVTPELQHLALDGDDGLVLASDSDRHLAEVVAGLGEEDLPEPLTETVAAAGEARTGVFYTGEHVCANLAMGQADAGDQAQAEQLVRAAGGVDPMTAFALTEQAGGGIRVVMAFGSEEQARANADARAQLAAGPAPGQGGAFGDRFAVEEVAAEGRLVTMRLDPREGEYVLSDLSTGPVLFATC